VLFPEWPYTFKVGHVGLHFQILCVDSVALLSLLLKVKHVPYTKFVSASAVILLTR